MNMWMRFRIVLLGLIAVMAVPRGKAADYYYDPSRGSGATWYGATNWSTSGFAGPFDSNWTDGNAAAFNFAATKIVSLADTDIQVAGITNASGNEFAVNTPTDADLTFSGPRTVRGGPVTFGWTGGGKIRVWGPVTSSCSTITFRETVELIGLATVTAGTMKAYPQALTNATIALAGGNLYLDNADTYPAIGSVDISSGEFRIGRYGGAAVAATVNGLSGTGGAIYPRLVNLASGGVVESLTVNQTTNTTYAGTVDGYEVFQGTSYLAVAKSGTGDLTLSGTVDLRQTTTLSGGGLYLTGGSAKSFRNVAGGAGSDAILVTGGALGGTSTVNVYGGADVTVTNGGRLVAGLNGTAGRSTYAFESGLGGQLDLSSATASNGWLHFDLGSNTTAGTTYDQIRVTGGTLAIGNGLLDFGDFAFNASADVGTGTYTLFDNAALTGTLGTSLSGRVGSAFHGALRVSGQNIVLDVTLPMGTVLYIR